MLFSISKLQLKIVFLFTLFFSLLNANTANYFCPADKAYIDFSNGKSTNIDSLKLYTQKDQCDLSCKIQNQCLFVAEQTPIKIIAQNSNVDPYSINKELSTLSSTIIGLNIKSNGTEIFSYKSKNPISIKALFPLIDKDNIKQEGVIATASATSFSLIDLKTKQEIIYIDSNIMRRNDLKISAKHIIKDKIPYTEITIITPENKSTQKIQKTSPNDLYELAGVNLASSQVNIALSEEESISIPLVAGKGEYITSYKGESYNTVSLGGKTLKFIAQLNSKNLSDVLYLIEIDKKTFANFTIDAILQSQSDHYACSYNNSIKGDLGLNAFSKKESCESACITSFECRIKEEVKKDIDPDCHMEEQSLDPITDINGNTIYMSKKVIKVCKKTRQKQVGCKVYNTQTKISSNAQNFLLNSIDVPTNLVNHDYKKAINVMGKAAIAENSVHIFSGEHDYCEDGIFYDPPTTSDIIKYAMMLSGPLLSSLSEGNSAAGGWEAFTDNAFKYSKDLFMESMKAFGQKMTWKLTAETVKKTILKTITQVAAKLLADKLDKSSKESEKKQSNSNDVAYMTNGADIGITADTSVRAIADLTGNSLQFDAKAASYAQCMAGRFDLSYYDIINYQQVGLGLKDIDSLSPEDKRKVENIIYTAKHPILVTAKEVGWLMGVMRKTNDGSVKVEEEDAYFSSRYRLTPITNYKGETNFSLIALAPEDLMIAAETICGGEDTISVIRDKYGARFLDTKLINSTLDDEFARRTSPPVAQSLPGLTSDSDDGEESKVNETLSWLSNIASAFPGPYGAISVAVLDLAKAFNKGDTCKDLKFAKERNEAEFIKTNKRLSAGLCTPINSGFVSRIMFNKILDPSVEYVGGILNRKRRHYCCYDQKITKILAEGIMQQLGRKMDTGCNSITVEDFDKITFNACKKGESPAINRCFPADKFNELADIFTSGGNIGIDKAMSSIIKSTLNIKDSLNDDSKPEFGDQK